MLFLLHSDDIKILQLLQHDARMTNKEIADKLVKTITPIYERIKKLEAEGYIDRYVALLSHESYHIGQMSIIRKYPGLSAMSYK